MLRDLNDLRLFAAVVAHGGFSAASRALAVPKSRLSRRVAALEADLGLRLLERSTRRFKVTEVGLDVARHARAALDEAEAIAAVAARLRAEPQGLVRVSCPLDTERLLAATLPAFLDRVPRLRVQLIVTNRRIDLVEEGVDVAIRVRERLDTDADLQIRVIGRSRSLLVASPAFAAAHPELDEPAAITALPTIGHGDRAGPHRWTLVDAKGQEAAITHEPRLAASAFAVLHQAAVDGIGLALLPESVCGEAIADGRLVRILPEWTSPEGVIHAVFTSRRGLLPGVRAVIDFVAETLRPGAASAR